MTFVSKSEQDQISRTLLMWLNQYPDKPVSRIEFESLPADAEGMSLSTIQGAFKVGEFITGAYVAQYQFAILYRTLISFTGERLTAEETLNQFGAWAEERADMPVLGAGKHVSKLYRNSLAGLIAKYENNAEDYQILMTMEYEVDP